MFVPGPERAGVQNDIKISLKLRAIGSTQKKKRRTDKQLRQTLIDLESKSKSNGIIKKSQAVLGVAYPIYPCTKSGVGSNKFLKI